MLEIPRLSMSTNGIESLDLPEVRRDSIPTTTLEPNIGISYSSSKQHNNISETPGYTQLIGCLHRISIEKRRSIRGSMCESLSHFIILLILVAGYQLSIIVHYENQIYSEVNIVIPPERPRTEFSTDASINAPMTAAESVGIIGLNLLKGPLVIPDLDQYVALGSAISSTGGSDFFNIFTQTGFGASFTNLLYPGVLHFAPRSAEIDLFVDWINTTYPTSLETLSYYIHDTEKDGIDYILNNLDEPAFALIVFHQISRSKVNFEIRQNYTTLPSTNEILVLPNIGLNIEYQKYLLSGFLTLEKLVNDWTWMYLDLSNEASISEECKATNNSAPSAVIAPFPTFKYDQNPFYQRVGFLLGLAMIMSTLYPMSKLTKSIVEEKETKMRELMKIMGLQDWVYVASWFLSAFILFFWIAVTSALITGTTFLLKTNKLLLFLYFFLFTVSEINFAFLVSVFFSNSKLAAIVAPVMLFCSILPRYVFYTTSNEEQIANKVLACLLSPTAFAFGSDIISQYEYGGVGVQFSNMLEGRFNFFTVLLMLWLDFYIYGFLAWYLDLVIPHENGTSRHPLFLFSWRYWLGDNGCCYCCCYCCCLCTSTSAPSSFDETFNSMPDFEATTTSFSIEPIPTSMINKAMVRVKGLGKQYPNGKVAVREVSMSMLEGQITCLLGHNGAGKTTMISMLTGLIEATTGDASIYNHSLQRQLRKVRTTTGLCPQQNVLFPYLTVEEHLRFFGRIKGITGLKLRDAFNAVIEEVGLTEKRDIRAYALSGGQKRKLCLAIALIGNPKFVLLDEPTSGMDPYSRRSTWELLQRNKAGRVIVLTTHFMDEADTLSDRIAIMSEGRLLCSGSSLFLKNRFGVGYLLGMSKTSQEVSVHGIQQEIEAIIPTVKIHSSVAGEVIFQLPLGSSPYFGQLFKMLQSKANDLGFGSYGISITTLEQVFIALAHRRSADDNNSEASTKDILLEEPVLVYSLFERFLNYIRASNCRVIPVTNIDKSNSKNMVIKDKKYQEVQVSDAEDTTVHPNSEGAVTLAIGNSTLQSANDTSSIGEESIQPVSIQPASIQPPFTSKTSYNKLSDSYSDGISKTNIFIQCSELYRKRLIIACRDWKGFFFQIIFPAVQIILIFLILTVEINISGRTIILNGDLIERYSFRPQTPLFLLAEGGSSDSSTTSVEDSTSFSNNFYGKFSALSVNATNSTDLSYYLLNKDSFEDSRMGSFVSNDAIKVRMTVDWDWVKTALPGLDITIPGAVLGDIALFVLGEGFTVTFSVNNTAINDLLLNTNASLISSFVDDDAISGYTPSDIVDTTSVTLTLLDSGVQVTLENPTVPLPLPLSSSFIIPWRTVDLSVLELFFPNGTTYNELDFGSLYTVMHNTSSPHNAAAWYSQLVQTAFQTCSLALPSSSIATRVESNVRGSNVSGSRRRLRERDSSGSDESVAAEEFVSEGDTETNPLYSDDDSIRSSVFTALKYYVKNHPLPITPLLSLDIRIILSLLMSIFILVPLCYIPAAFVVFVVKERVSKSKHLQIVSGVSPYLYWFSTYLWDISLFAVLTLFIIIAFFGFGQNLARVFIGDAETTMATICLLLVYGASSVPLCYIYSFAFTNFSTAQIVIMVINFMTGFVMVLAYYIMVNVPQTVKAGKALVHFFRFFPPYNVGEGLINLSTSYYERNILGSSQSVFAWTVTGRSLVFMFVESIGYFSLILISELPVWRDFGNLIVSLQSSYKLPPPRKNETDEDVSNEENLVNSLYEKETSPALEERGKESAGQEVEEAETREENKAVLLLRNLIKTYPSLDIFGKPKYAVRGISLACYEGERFGLLGINGAGKTTTLGILTGEILQTMGTASIGGRGLSDPTTMQMIGYCPQVDPLLDLMNAYETLWFFGRIRGIDTDVLKTRVTSLITQTGLTPHAHRPCGTYSGGNKRKLSLAVALIGDPKVLLLDEPSTGMDPEARRQMWTVIQQVSTHRTVILVSHSMEEIEALCTRVAVMVSGRIQCLGSVQHLKGKFGTGYQVEVRCSVRCVQTCLSLCLHLFSSVTVDVEEQHGGYFRLHVSGVDVGTLLGDAFETLEREKLALEMYDYSISQCSLEQVFIRFARDQEEEPANKGDEPNNSRAL